MTKAELESKHLAELHALAAKEGVPGYRMLPRAELIEKLASGEPERKAPPRRERSRPAAPPAAVPESTPAQDRTSPEPASAPARTSSSEDEPPRPRRRRRRRFRRGGGKGAGPRKHADRWLEAWNAHDLDAIVACYAEDVDYAAPAAAAGREDRRVSGREELREHFARGLELAPNLAFDEESLLIGPAGYALLYRREDGHRAIEAVELGESGLVTRARVYYEREQS
jgi:hypothetical protein